MDIVKNVEDMFIGFDRIHERVRYMDRLTPRDDIGRAYASRGSTRSPATAGTANRSLLFLEHRIPMPELFTELRFSILREFWAQEIRLPLLGGDAPRLG